MTTPAPLNAEEYAELMDVLKNATGGSIKMPDGVANVRYYFDLALRALTASPAGAVGVEGHYCDSQLKSVSYPQDVCKYCSPIEPQPVTSYKSASPVSAVYDVKLNTSHQIWYPKEQFETEGTSVIGWLSSHKGFEDLTAEIQFENGAWVWANSLEPIKRQDLIRGVMPMPKPSTNNVQPQDGWIKITRIEDMPQKKTKSYEQYDCMVWWKGEAHHLVWNCEHLVWDDRTGDDFECEWNAPTHYKLCSAPAAPTQHQTKDGE